MNLTSMPSINVANSIFPGFNDYEGIMLCGYEWGFSKKDQSAPEEEATSNEKEVLHTFSNKALQYGEKAKFWKYDNRIIHWFNLFGHKLDQQGLGGDFEKCILQTNWCNTQNHKIEVGYTQMLLASDQIDNFIYHIRTFRPKLILFFGSQLIRVLQNPSVLPRFVQIMGQITEPLRFVQKKEFAGRKFKIGFQGFENCQIICLPHPSGSHGLEDSYINAFRPEIEKHLSSYKYFKKIIQ